MANVSIGTYLNLCTTKGRIVKGSTHELITSEWKWDARTKRYVETPLAADKHKYSIHFALRKNDPAVLEMLQKMYLHVRNIYLPYPNVVAAIDRLIQAKSGFAWKIYDGDVANVNTGKVDPNCAGCYILQFDTRPPRMFRTIRWDNQPIPVEQVRTGYECDIAFSIIDNGLTTSIPGGASAGIYLNATFVRYLGTGEEIVRGPSADQLMPAAAAPQNAFPSEAPAPTGFGGGASFTPAPLGFASTAAPQQQNPGGMAAGPVQSVHPSEVTPPLPQSQPQRFVPPSLPDLVGVPVAQASEATEANAPMFGPANGASSPAETVSPISAEPVVGFSTGQAQ